MKIKAIFGADDQLLGWMEVTENFIDFVADDGERIYELEVDHDLSQNENEYSEQMEEKIRAALECV